MANHSLQVNHSNHLNLSWSILHKTHISSPILANLANKLPFQLPFIIIIINMAAVLYKFIYLSIYLFIAFSLSPSSETLNFQ